MNVHLNPQGFKANPRLELANDFGVKFKLHQYPAEEPQLNISESDATCAAKL